MGGGKKLIPVYHACHVTACFSACSIETLKMQTSASTASYGRGVFVGKSRVKAATSMTISTCNEGASAILTVMERLWLHTTVVTVDVMRETDMLRMSKAEAITSATVKRR